MPARRPSRASKSRRCADSDRSANGSRLNFAGTLGYLDAQYDEFITNIPGQPGRSTSPISGASRTRRNGRFQGRSTTPSPLAGGELSAINHLVLPEQDLPVRNAEPVPRSAGLRPVGRAASSGPAPTTATRSGSTRKNILDKQYITSGYQFLAVNPVTGVPLLTPGRATSSRASAGKAWSPPSTAIRARSSLSFGLNF